MIHKHEISRGQFVALLAALIMVCLIAIGWSGLVHSGEVVLMFIVVTAYAGIFPFLLGVAIQAVFRTKRIPLPATWALALFLVALQWIFTRKSSVRVLDQDIISILVSFIITGVFINVGIKSCRAFMEARKTKEP